MAPASRRRLGRLLGALLVVSLISAWLWWLDHRPHPDSDRGGETSSSRGPARDRSAAPEAALPTRTALRPGDAPTARGLSCPLEVYSTDGMVLETAPLVAIQEFVHVDAAGTGQPVRVVFSDEGTVRVAAEVQALAVGDGPLLLLGPAGDLLSIELSGGDCRRAQLSVADRVLVSCPVVAGWDPRDDVLRVLLGGRQVPWDVAGGALQFAALDARGQALLELVDGARIPVRWGADGCEEIDPGEALATLQLTVLDRRLDPRIWVTGCGMRPRRVVANVGIEVAVVPEPCLLEAWRTDGALRALAEPVYVDPLPGDVIEVSLELPEHRMAGMGISFRMEDEVAVVRGVRAETPAWAAGLRRGDRVLAVDGESTEGMTDNDFIAFGTGPEGTEVELLVEDEAGHQRTIALERSLIER